METLELCVQWGGLAELGPDLERYLERRCRDSSEVDDVVQETLLRAARYRASLNDVGRLRGWIFRIARNVLRDAKRREGRIPRADLGEDPFEYVEGREPDPSGAGDSLRPVGCADAFDKAEMLRGLNDGLWTLSSEDRRVLWSYYAGAMSCAETSAECDIPHSLVKVRLFRARRRLLRALVGDGGTPSAPEPPGGALSHGRTRALSGGG